MEEAKEEGGGSLAAVAFFFAFSAHQKKGDSKVRNLFTEHRHGKVGGALKTTARRPTLTNVDIDLPRLGRNK